MDLHHLLLAGLTGAPNFKTYGFSERIDRNQDASVSGVRGCKPQAGSS
jgi:hypothetical protein